MPRSHYDNLQISRSASDRVIKAAYKSLAHEWHPDRNSDRWEEAEQNIKIINEAYRVLINPELRSKHDNWLKHQEDILRSEQHRYDQQRQQYGNERNQYYQPDEQHTDHNKTPQPGKRLPWKSTWWVGAIIGLLISLIPDKSTGFTPLSEIALSLQTGASFSIWGSTLIGVYLAGCLFAVIIIAVIRGFQK